VQDLDVYLYHKDPCLLSALPDSDYLSHPMRSVLPCIVRQAGISHDPSSVMCIK